MTKRQAFLRKQLIIKIHIHPRYKEIKANGAWEDWLQIRYNEKSSALLPITELQEVVSILNGIGRDRDFPLIDPDRKLYVKNTALSYAQKQKIQRLQEELGWSNGDLNAFIQRQIKNSKIISDLTAKEATKVITGLERTLSYNLKKLKSSEIYHRVFKTANNPNYSK